MVDTPTTEYGFRLQELGTNVNTWGDTKLNEVIEGIAQTLGGYKSIAITGNYTLTSTNYVTTADNRNRVLEFTGALSAAANIIVPSSDCVYFVKNSAGQTLTFKTSAGTGFAVPDDRQAIIYCDGVNCYSAVPNYIGTTFIPSLNGDIANVLYVDTAIANASIPASAGTVLVSGGDTTAGYLGGKVAAGTGIALTILNPAADEDLEVAISGEYLTQFAAENGAITATISSGTTAMTARRRYRISGAATGTLPTMVSGDWVIVEFTNGAGITATVGRNSQTIDGSATDDTYIGDGSQSVVIRYDYASAGAVTSRLIEGIPA